MDDHDNGTIDRLRSDCRALAGALAGCDPAGITVDTYGGSRPRASASFRGISFAHGFGDTTEAALADLRRELVAACADRVTELVAEARGHDEEAERCRRTADALSRVVSAAREEAPDAR